MYSLFKITKIIVLFFVVFSIFLRSYAEDNIKFLYISNLNLLPTPISTKTEKSNIEKKYGFLIYESQSVFQEFIRYVNQKLDFDFVVFGGNNIFFSKNDKSIDINEDIWQLFLDMASEIKSQTLIAFGENEIKTKNTLQLLRALNLYGIKADNTWWSYSFKNYLFVSLNSFYFLSNHLISKEELNWFKNVLLKNKNKFTIVFLDEALVNSNFEQIKNNYVNEFYEIVNKNPQIKLIASSSKHFNRIKLVNNKVHVISSSLISFPCSFKLIEVSPAKIKIKSYPILLKGIVKKAERSLFDSEFRKEFYPNSLKEVKRHVLGLPQDADFEVDLSNL